MSDLPEVWTADRRRRDCNGNLNEAFETPCKPVVEQLIAGSSARIDLTADEQRLAASWMLKTNLVKRLGDHTQRGPSPENREMLRVALLVSLVGGVPPLACFVRIGGILLEDDDDAAFSPGRPFVVAKETAYAAALTGVTNMGFLVWESSLLPMLVEPGVHVELPPDDPRLVRIWPPVDDPAQWPGSDGFFRGDLIALHEAWLHPPEIFNSQMWRSGR